MPQVIGLGAPPSRRHGVKTGETVANIRICKFWDSLFSSAGSEVLRQPHMVIRPRASAAVLAANLKKLVTFLNGNYQNNCGIEKP